MSLPRWFVVMTGIVSLGVWVASFVAGLLRPDYRPDPIVGYIAMAVVGACFATDLYQSIAGARRDVKRDDRSNGTRR